MHRRSDRAVAGLVIGMGLQFVTGHCAAETKPGTVSLKRIDLCAIASTDTLQALLQNGIQQLFPIPLKSGGESVELSRPSIEQVSCPHMSIKVRAEVHYRRGDARSPTQTSGNMIMASPMAGDLQFAGIRESTTVTAANLRQGLAWATNPQILELKIDNAPSWLGPSWLRACLNGEHAEWDCRDVIQRMRFNVTQLVQFYLQQGSTL